MAKIHKFGFNSQFFARFANGYMANPNGNPVLRYTHLYQGGTGDSALLVVDHCLIITLRDPSVCAAMQYVIQLAKHACSTRLEQ